MLEHCKIISNGKNKELQIEPASAPCLILLVWFGQATTV
jgi:hypothetical protein